MSYEICIEISGIVGDFLANPIRQANFLTLIAELDFCDHKTLIIASEIVNLPNQPFKGYFVAGLLDQRSLA